MAMRPGILCWCAVISLVALGCGDDSGSDTGANTPADMPSNTVPDMSTNTMPDMGSSGAGAGGDMTDTSDTGGAGQPAAAPETVGSTEAELEAYLQAESYRGAGWAAQTEAPRERSSDVSPHGRVRVWRNDALLASQAAGNGTGLDAPAHDTGSMVVKEFYDDTDQLLGRATMLKLEGDMRQWAYYCNGPDDRCMDTSPTYGVGFGVSCSFCHGGLVYTQ